MESDPERKKKGKSHYGNPREGVGQGRLASRWSVLYDEEKVI